MSDLSRRTFLHGVGAMALTPFLQLEEPTLILYNGNIWTGDPAHPAAQAVAVTDGRFTAIGSNEEVLHLAAGRSRKIDLEHKYVLPGFIDAHAHPLSSGRQLLRMVACESSSIPQILTALRQRAQKTQAGHWVLGFLYDDGKTERPLDRHDLDEAVPSNPVLIYHRGGHTAFGNSLAFKTASIDDRTPDPAGGHFGKDASGHLNGRIADNAVGMIDKFIPSTNTPEESREAAKLITKMMTAKGITSVGDAQASPEDLQAYQDAYAAGNLSMRVYCIMFVDGLNRMMAAGIHTRFGDEWVRVGGMKQFADGSISERTARLSQPYIGIPNYYGLFLSSEEELYENGRKAHAAGWQLSTHANGDVAIERVLNVYERIHREIPRRDPRFRIEHCSLINDSIIQRMRALRAIPVPFSCYVYFHGDIMHFYGQERLQHMFAMRNFLDAGLRPTDSSDYTASPFDPMMWLQSQVTRTDIQGKVWGANQRITLEEALRCGTIHGAYASFEEHLKGSIKPGKLADLIVLGQDPFSVHPMSLAKIPIERTMVGGRWMHEA